MKIKISDLKDKIADPGLEIVLCPENDGSELRKEDKGALERMGWKGKGGEFCLLPESGRLYAGLKDRSPAELRILMAELIRFLLDKNFSTLSLAFAPDKQAYEMMKALIEGALLGAYRFDHYKSRPEKIVLQKLFIRVSAGKEDRQLALCKRAEKEARIIAKSVNLARDIVNQTPEDVSPLTMSELAKTIAKESGLRLRIQGEKYIKAQGMGAFYAVSKASPYPPQLIHLTHKPAGAKTKVVLVGKGLTFDTGGLNVKTGDHMLTMKMDKAGACTIFGVMKAVAALKLPLEVHGIIGAVENAVGQHAYKPDDVLKAKNGKTIEVKNTDAEGRLVLADCLCYAQDLKPDRIIDVATLTGACVVALGEYTIGAMGHDQTLLDSLRRSAEASGELLAELPFNRYLPKLLSSNVADISNVSSSRYGGAITAGLFLSEFIEEKNKSKWAHLDIAGPAYSSAAWGENPIGASGAGVRLLVEWLTHLSL